MDDRHEQRQRIILVSELFYPEEASTAHILTKITEHLAFEYELLVLTGPVSHEGKSCQNRSRAPVDERKIVRTRSLRFSNHKLIGRFFRQQVLTISLAWKILLTSRRTDFVFAVTNPASLLFAVAIIQKLRRFRLVILVHDIFPDNAAAAGIIQSDQFLYKTIKRIFEWSYGAADAVITIGRDMSDVLARKNPAILKKITLIENWADEPLVERIPRDQSLISSMGLSENIVIQYAGNIGRAQGLLEFVDLVSATNNDVIRYVFRGSGALFAALQGATEGLNNFIVEGAYPRSSQSQILGACDIALVILRSGMYGLGVPSKTYNILAAGKPILFLGPKHSEIYRLVKQHDVGWAFDWNEADKLVDCIRRWSIEDLPAINARGDRARKLAETAFTEAGQLAKFSALFHRLRQPAV